MNKYNVIIGISFAYIWMPTILEFRQAEIEKVVQILNLAKNGTRPSLSELSVLKKKFNNLLAGSSKLLHFINPNLFAIWDSRVYRSLFNLDPYTYRVEDPKTYMKYLSYFDDISIHRNSDNVHNLVESKVGYTLSKMRSIEIIHFYTGQKELQ